MKTTKQSKTVAVVVESSFLQAFAGTQPGKPATKSTRQTPGGIDMAAWNRARVAELTSPGPGNWDY